MNLRFNLYNLGGKSLILLFSLLGTGEGEEVFEIEDVVVTETREELETGLIPSSVSVIQERELEERPYKTLRDILIFDSSLFITRQRGTDFLSIRGFTGGRILILIDGKRIAGELDRSYELDRLTLEKVKRIEIIKGPSSVLYGSDALGGIINIITKEPIRRRIDFSINYGSLGQKAEYYRFSLAAYSGKKGNINFGVFGRLSNNNAFSLPDGATPIPKRKLNIAGFSFFYYLRESKARIDYDFTEHNERYVLSGGTSVKLDTKRHNASVELGTKGNRKNSSFIRAYTSLYRKDYEVREQTGKLKDFDKVERGLYVLEGFTAFSPQKTHKLTVGGELRKENFTSSRLLGGNFEGEVEREGVVKNLWKVEENYWAVYIQNEWTPIERFYILGGVRYEGSDVFKDKLTPRIGITAFLTEFLRFKVNYSQGYRVPTPSDRYLFFPGFGYWVMGNRNLDVEETNNYELGLELEFPSLYFDINLFYTKAKNLIDITFLCVGGTPSCTANGTEVPSGVLLFSYENLKKAELKGAELSLLWKPKEIFLLKFSYTYLDAKDLTEGQRLLQRPRHRIVGKGTINIKKFKLSLSLFGEFVYDMLFSPKDKKSYSLLHMSLRKELIKGLNFEVFVENLINKKDYEFGLVGRSLQVSLKGNF